MIMHRKIITLNTIHIVYNRTEQATEQAGETRLHPAGCNLLNRNNKLHIIQNFILDEDNIPKT